MASFHYKGRDKESHKPVTGAIVANNEQDAIKKLRAKGVLVLSVSTSSSSGFTLPFLNRVGTKDRILFTRQLAVMIKAGLPILQALKAIKDQTTSKTLTKAVQIMISEIEGGTSLSDAFSHHPRIFPPIFISMAKIGEKSGKLEDVLNKLAIQIEKDEEIVGRVKSAMIYPVFVLVALVAVMILIMVYIIPQLKSIFDDSGVELPALTRFMLALSAFLSKYIAGILIVAALIFVGLKMAGRNPKVKLFYEQASFHLPVFGDLLRKVLMTRFTNTLSTLLGAGLPMVEAIKTTAEVMNSPTYQISLHEITKHIEGGSSLSHGLLGDKQFPSMIGNMAAIGEESGNIDIVLKTVGEFFDKEVEAMTRNLSAAIEPLLMLVMGVAVALVISSVIMPIYGLVNAV